MDNNEASHPRMAVTSDLAGIQAVVDSAYNKYLSRMDRPPAPLLRDYSADIRDDSIWVIGNPIIGIISMTPKQGCLFIMNVAVHPKVQGTGVGRRLMEFAEKEASRLDLKCLRLRTNEIMVENIAIYTHLGYVEVGRRIEDGYRRVYMEKILPSRC